MSDVSKSIAITIDDAHEGGFQRNSHDRANWSSGQIGVGTLVGTKYGITALDMPGVDLEHLTPEQATDWYLTTHTPQRFNNPLYALIQSQPVCDKLFDMGVLFGVGTAVRMLQIALDLAADGVFGSLTLAATNWANATILLHTFKDELHAHAKSVAAANPNEAPFLPDWSRRIDS